MRTDRRYALAALLILAAVLRVAAAWTPAVHHPDEIFQYLEQAHRLVFGYGYIPWEYRDGMRSWLVPGLFAAPMRLGSVLPGDAYLLLPRLAVALATVGIVWGVWRIGARESRVHAWLAAAVAAIWYDQVYFAAHTLTETIATAAAVPGAALLARGPSTARPEPVEGRPSTGSGRAAEGVALAAALLAFAALVRPHYAPALILLVAWRCRLDPRAWAIATAGALPVLAVSALVDLASGSTPFGWLIANYHRNVVDGAQATYGLSGPLYYLKHLRDWWGLAFAPLIFLGVLGSRRQPQLLAAAVVTIALHMAIGHKELRFILLAMTLLVILAALGTADIVTMTARRRLWGGVALAGWAAASLAGATTGEMRWRWSDNSPALAATRAAARDPALCGLAAWDMRYWQSGGWTYLHRDVPIYPVTARDELGTPPMDPATLARITPGFNAILTTPAGRAAMPSGYRQTACFVPEVPFADHDARAARAICLYRRAGGCDPGIAAAWRLR